jgi:hypothetical protein
MRRRLVIGAAFLALAGPAAGSPPQHPVHSRTPVIVWHASTGFQWLDAAIGAAAAVGVVLIALGLFSNPIMRRKR